MGFVTRTGLTNFTGYLNPRIYLDSPFWQRVGFELTTSQTKDRPSGLWETANDLAVNVFFGGNWLFRTRFNYSTEVFNAQTFQTSGIHTQVRGQIMKEIFATLVLRRTRAIRYATGDQGKRNVIEAALTLQPWENFRADLNYTYTDYYSDATGTKLFKQGISRAKLTYQFNQYLFLRAIGEYIDPYRTLTPEFLASFTYIPGTVVYLGYGGLWAKAHWDGTLFLSTDHDDLLELYRGLFLKMSYLWRS